jgi:O-antigen ligase
MIVAVVAVLLWLFLFSKAGSVAEQHVLSAYLKQGSSEQDLSGGRFSIWRTGIETWRKRPILGLGFGQPLSGYVMFGSVAMFYDVLWPHNIAIQFLYQTGIIGSIILVGIILAWLRGARSTVKRTVSVRTADGYVYRAIVVFVVTIFMASLYGQFLLSSTTGFLFWACMGLEAALAVKLTALSVSKKQSHLTVDQVVAT